MAMAARTLALAFPLPLCAVSSPRRATPLALPRRGAARPLASLAQCPARGQSPSPRRAAGRALAPCAAMRGSGGVGVGGEFASDDGGGARALLRATLWGAEAAYILWLFLLPYAPGDPVWGISQATISDLIGLSLNFFLILPLLNSAGVHLLESPVLHPVAEGLFNFVIAWTLLFAPLLFTDSRRDRFKGSLDLLWGFQMFLTNTFLIPYMAIRLNDPDKDKSPPQTSKLGSVMVRGAPIVGLTGGLVCILSIAWALFGRADASFGGIAERWQYVQSYVFSERLAYAFLWDILLYSIFQPWLIADNIQNVKASATEFVNSVRFLPVIGLVAYLFCLEDRDD
ncbi:hypothetical protein OsJ_15072 [Oryza sativa Japonica Group]|uniref:Uncharacterized protein n=1 Tax=Oryza sativa subsp. japonica TaxID=39947 RepID=B9FFK1_ORYSJ|nr:hypothetical protein OsJ_15072 [Oryza sativa Japonica Group]